MLSTPQLLIVFGLTAFLHTVDTGAYASRLAGVRTGRIALAQSLYNILALGSRGANALVAPLIASLTDTAVRGHNAAGLLTIYRTTLLAASAGTLLAGLLIPSLSRVLARGVASYELRRSLPRVVVRSMSVRGLVHARHELKSPQLSAIIDARRCPFPKRFLIISVLVMAIYTVTTSAAMYASTLVPEGARTAASLTPLLTGIGVVLTTFLTNPLAAFVIDEALRGQRPLSDVTYITIWQVGARFAGTLLAQLLLQPFGIALAWITTWLIH